MLLTTPIDQHVVHRRRVLNYGAIEGGKNTHGFCDNLTGVIPMCVWVCVCVCGCVCVCVGVCVWVWVYVGVGVGVCGCVCVGVGVCVCGCGCVCVGVGVYAALTISLYMDSEVFPFFRTEFE